MAFKPSDHLMQLKGKDYLPVAWRLVWFREEHPDWGIVTEPIQVDTEKGIAVFKATVQNVEGKAIGTGTKSETARGFADFIEKAETGAIGRALAVCGYGTQFEPELEEGERIVDSPQARPQAQPAPKPQPKPASPVADGQAAKFKAEIVAIATNKAHFNGSTHFTNWLRKEFGIETVTTKLDIVTLAEIKEKAQAHVNGGGE